jgi:FdrA protein
MTATMTLAASVFPRLYRDSVALLALASKLQQREHIVRAGVVMATPANLRLLAESDMLPAGVTAGADDLLITVKGWDAGAVEDALAFASTALSSTDAGSSEVSERRPQTIVEGIAGRPGATVATVSVPGTYAALVAEQALRRGLHVMCFSDNVPVEDEVRLKTLAAQRRLLMMGPDCGTAVLDGVPLGFANVLRPGPVGIVAASGTGAQEVSCLLDRAGVGNAALIGVGGRDLTAPVGGVMTELALDLLVADRSAEVIVVVSKPPAPAVAERLLSRLGKIAADGTPVVACLLGMDDADEPVAVRGTLEGAAIQAARLAGVSLAPAVAEPAAGTELTMGTGPAGRVLGLYTGGTLAGEAKVLLGRAGLWAEVIDLGDDQYTAGRPHPMIDPTARAARIVQAAGDPAVSVVLLDVVLGHGAHTDPAGAAAAAAREARSAAGRPMAFVASICGTAADPQGFDAQARTLREAGVLLAGSNAAAARLAIRLAGGADAEGGRP